MEPGFGVMEPSRATSSPLTFGAPPALRTYACLRGRDAHGQLAARRSPPGELQPVAGHPERGHLGRPGVDGEQQPAVVAERDRALRSEAAARSATAGWGSSPRGSAVRQRRGRRPRSRCRPRSWSACRRRRRRLRPARRLRPPARCRRRRASRAAGLGRGVCGAWGPPGWWPERQLPSDRPSTLPVAAYRPPNIAMTYPYGERGRQP